MAFQIYAGWKEGEVWKRVPVKIAQGTSFTGTESPGSSGQFPFKTKGYFNVDETPTDIGAIFVTNVLNNDLNTDKKRLYFFSSNNDGSLLPFELLYFRHLRYNNVDQYHFFFYDRVTGGATYGATFAPNTLSLVINPRYSGNSLEGVYASAEMFVKNRELSGNYEFFLNFPEYAPLNPCINDGNSEWYVAYKYLDSWYDGPDYYVKNLSNIYQWKHFLTGKSAYESMPELETMDGEKVVIGYPDSAVVHDPGKLTEITTSGSPEKCYAFRYLTNATDITSLFPTLISETEEFVYLKNGWISRQIVHEGNTTLYRYKIGYGAKYFAWDCTSDPQNPLPYEFSENQLNADLTHKSGLYLITSPAYGDIPANKWADKIPKNYIPGSFEESPFLLYRYGFEWGGPYTDYWDVVLFGDTEYPRYLTNYGTFSNNRYNGEIVFSSSSTGDRETWLGILEGFKSGDTPNYGEGSRGGGFSSTGGGNGSYDDSSSSIQQPSSPSGISGTSGLFSMYAIGTPTLNSIGNWLVETWTDEKKSDTINSKLQSIISFKQVCAPGLPNLGSPTQIKAFDEAITGAIGDVITAQYRTFNMGSYTFTEYFGSFLDYAPHTIISLYLPFVGIVSLDTNTVMGGTVTLSCGVDWISGNITYNLSLKKDDVNSVLNTWSGNSASDIPLSQLDYSNKIAAEKSANMSLLALAGSAIAAGVGIALAPSTGGSSIAAGLKIAGSVGTLGAAATAVKQVSNYQMTEGQAASSIGGSGSVGFMNVKTPYLIIDRPISSLPEDYAHINGFMSNMAKTIGDLSGYTEISDCNLNNFSKATDKEVNEIMSILKAGVLL